MLSDPKKRKEYDSRGFAGVSGFSQEDLFGGINFDDIFGGAGFGFDFGGFGGGSIFDSFFHRGHPRETRGADIRVEVVVPLEKILSGGEEQVRIAHPRECTECKGSGSAPGTQPRICTTCNGTGQLVNTRQEGNVSYQQITMCPGCHGEGKFIDNPCPVCGGTGTIDKAETLTVRIPKGAEEGMVLRVPDHGMPSTDPSKKSGDLLVIVRTAYDPRFRRVGADLWHTQGISLVDAVLGADLKVMTLEGPVTVHVPPGTQSDSVLRLGKKGLPYFGENGRGDLYLRVNVRIPETLSSEQKTLYERLRELEPSSE